MKFLKETGDKVTVDYFLIPDKDDHRLAPDFTEWKKDYREFLNFSRLNIVLSLCSCFEIYLRSITSLAIESKPGVILGDKNAVDGAKLLKSNRLYSEYNENTYPFYKQVDSVCRGSWDSRIAAYEKLFGAVPVELQNSIAQLDDFRKLRNNIAHYYGREKSKYDTPLFINAESVTRVAHDRLIKFLQLVYKAARTINKHLYVDFVGAYEVLKCFLTYKNTEVEKRTTKGQAKLLHKILGHEGVKVVGTEYYNNLLTYFEHL